MKIQFEDKLCRENKCTVDPTLKVCPKCFRTLEEIDFWDEYSYVDKMMIFRATQKRKRLQEEFEDSLSQDLSIII